MYFVLADCVKKVIVRLAMIIDETVTLPDDLSDAVVAIGNFDGVHRGHQYLLAQGKAEAKKRSKPLLVLSFEPHPKQFFDPDCAPFRVAPLGLKSRHLVSEGADAVIILSFNEKLCSMSAEDFVTRILSKSLRAGIVVVGEGFRFGHKRAGDTDLIRSKGIDVLEVPPFEDADGVVSSTRVRELLRAGDLLGAQDLLGWQWEIEGEVIKGDQRGREMGFPTANIAFGETLCPSYGVYAVEVLIEGGAPFTGQWIHGAANIGVRPMFEIEKPLLEVHIFDFSHDIYGRTLRVRPVAKIRDEAKYDSLDALIEQIGKDCAVAKDILSKV